MLPKTHVLYGAIFALLFWFAYPETNWLFVAAVFFGAIFIDFDHYATVFYKTGKISVASAYKYCINERKKEIAEKKKGIFKKGDFHAFHTIEFHLFVLMLGFLWAGFWYILAGMVFHSLLDFFWMLYERRLYRREYFLANWIYKKL